MTRVTSSNKDMLFAKLDTIGNTLNEPQEGLDPIELYIGVAFSNRTEPDRDVFRNADIALSRVKETKHAGYSVY